MTAWPLLDYTHIVYAAEKHVEAILKILKKFNNLRYFKNQRIKFFNRIDNN